MSNDRRFALDEGRYVIDAVNPANSGKAYCPEEDPEDERHLRERVLVARLREMLDKLIIDLIDLWPTQYHEERHAILLAIYGAIQASLSFDPATMAIQYTGGTLKRNKGLTEDFTSLSLFYDDVECLLRDLYGDIGSEALDRVLRAVCRIVKELTKYLCPDLWKEHRDAEDFDWIIGGAPKSWGISSTDHRCGMKAKANLFRRVREVNANPSTFSEYSREFAKLFAERWDCSKEDEWEAKFLEMPC